MTTYFTGLYLSVDATVTSSVDDVDTLWAEWTTTGDLSTASLFDGTGDVFRFDLSPSKIFTNQYFGNDQFFACVSSGGIGLRENTLFASTSSAVQDLSVAPFFRGSLPDATSGSDLYLIWSNDDVGETDVVTPYKVAFPSVSTPRNAGILATLTFNDSSTVRYAWSFKTGQLRLALTPSGRDQPVYVINRETLDTVLITTVLDGETSDIVFDIAWAGVVGNAEVDLLSAFSFNASAVAYPMANASINIAESLLVKAEAEHSVGARPKIDLASALNISPSVFNSSLDAIGSTNVYYTMTLDKDGDAIEIPISSWQATIQVGRQSFAQCVVPAVASYVSAINAAETFTIYRRAVTAGGFAVSSEMLTSPIGTRSYSRGPQNYTCTLNGYSDAFDGTGSPTPIEAQGVRSITDSNGSYRIRCAIDWVLRPNNVIRYDGTDIEVAFINYYVNATDQYMDVGDR